MTDHRVRLTRPEDVVLAIPSLLGQVPAESLVLLMLHEDDHIAAVVRTVLPPATAATRDGTSTSAIAGGVGEDKELVDHVVRVTLTVPMTRDPSITRVRAVVVSQTKRRDVALALESAAVLSGLHADPTLWVASITTGARWECFEHCRCHGVLPDPRTSPMALAAAVHGGRHIAPDRTALDQQLRPVDPATLARRARLLASASLAEACDRATALLEQAMSSSPSFDDDLVITLGLALTDRHVRHAALQHCLTADGAAAETAWTVLVRGLPGRYAAGPACMLTISMLLRGDAPMAVEAVARALAADPGLELAGLLAMLIATGIGPEELRRHLGDNLA